MNRILSLGLLLISAGAFAQNPTLVGESKFSNLFSASSDWRTEADFGRRVEQAGRALIGTPYVGWTLERDPKREFVFHTLEGLDCVTFVESAMAMARIAPNPRPTPNAFLRAIQQIRYRDGRVEGYLSRLHYTSDWMDDQVKRGLLQDVTASLPGAMPLQLNLGFMSSNPNLYPALRENPSLLPRLRELEKEISGRPRSFVPAAGVAAIESLLQPGDVVGFTTSVAGLDTSHVGLIAVDRNKTRRLLHASSDKKAVVLDVRLSEYMAGKSKMTGLFVVRPLLAR